MYESRPLSICGSRKQGEEEDEGWGRGDGGDRGPRAVPWAYSPF